MSLLKIPFILSTASGIHITMTPPNPPPQSHERLKPSGAEIFIPWTAVFWKVCGLEFQSCFSKPVFRTH